MQILKIQKGGVGGPRGGRSSIADRQWSLNRSPRATLSGDLPKLASLILHAANGRRRAEPLDTASHIVGIRTENCSKKAYKLVTPALRE
jgi:hypothetical protein